MKKSKGTMKKSKGGKGVAITTVRSPEERAEAVRNSCLLTGTMTESTANRIIHQIAAMQVWGRDSTDVQKTLAAVDLIAEFMPTSPIEALLAVQMFGVHEAATTLLRRATLEGQTLDGIDANVLRATRLMRLFNEQVELMARLKGKASQQKVTVEHVHVYQGGQAIVGAVSSTKDETGGGG